MKQTLIEPHKSHPNLKVGKMEIVGAWLFREDGKITISVNYVKNHPRRGSSRENLQGVKRPHNMKAMYREIKSRGRVLPVVYMKHDDRFYTLVDWQILGPFIHLLGDEMEFGDSDPIRKVWWQELCRVLDVEYAEGYGSENPILNEFNRRRYPLLGGPAPFVKATTTDDVRHFTQSNLGKQYTNKPMMKVFPKAVSADEGGLSVGLVRNLRNYFTREELAATLAWHLEVNPWQPNLAGGYTSLLYRSFMDIMDWAYARNASSQRKARILAEIHDNRDLARDTVSMLRPLRHWLPNTDPWARAQSLQQLHDMLVPDYVRYQEEEQARMDAQRAERDENFALMLRKMDSPTDLQAFKGLEKVTLDGLTIRAPRTPNELMEWGSEMQHCIGSYRSQLIAGEVFLGIYNEEGKLLCNAHARRGYIVQVLGKYNESADDEIVRTVFTALYHHNIVGINAYDRYTKEGY